MKIFLPRHTQCNLVTIHESSIDGFIKTNKSNSTCFVDNAKDADMIVLFEQWSTKFWQYADQLLHSDLVNENISKVFVINNDDLGRGHLPGCYVSLTKRNFDPELHKACCYPYVINKFVSEEAWRSKHVSPTHLFSFRGNLASYPIRRALLKLFNNSDEAKVVPVDTEFHAHSDVQKKEYVQDILQSKFVLCPRGASPSTYRLFEVMELGRCPVIISDDWVQIDGVNWGDFAIVVPESSVEAIPEILRRHADRAMELGRCARASWEANFSESRRFEIMLTALIELRGKLQGKSIDYRQRWRSWSFYYANGWTLPQRARTKLHNMLQNHRADVSSNTATGIKPN
jgi:hypothetical protein